MKFKEYEPMTINSLGHINSHVSYLLTCNSKADDDPEGYAEGNIIAYYKDNQLIIENGYDLKKRTALAKEIRKKANESLGSLSNRAVKSKMRTELSYLEGLTKDVNTNEGFNKMVEHIEEFIYNREAIAKINKEETFIYVFHLHQDQMPHLHRFFRLK